MLIHLFCSKYIFRYWGPVVIQQKYLIGVCWKYTITKQIHIYNILDGDKCYKKGKWEWWVKFLFYVRYLGNTFFRRWPMSIELKEIRWEQNADIQDKFVLGRGSSNCKNSKLSMCLVYSRHYKNGNVTNSRDEINDAMLCRSF